MGWENRQKKKAPIATNRKRLALLSVLGALLALGLWSRFPSTVRPPATVADPVTIQLFSVERHAGLLLPCGDGRTVEYGYGQWDWYALARDDWWRAPATVLWPSQGCLGRRYVLDDELAAKRGSYSGGMLAELHVARASAERFLARLDEQFAADGDPIRNELYDMSFVKHQDDFWMFHDCHDEVAEWLEELGCTVSWAPIRTGLRVAR